MLENETSLADVRKLSPAGVFHGTLHLAFLTKSYPRIHKLKRGTHSWVSQVSQADLLPVLCWQVVCRMWDRRENWSNRERIE